MTRVLKPRQPFRITLYFCRNHLVTPVFIFLPSEMRSSELRPGIQIPYLDQCRTAVYTTRTSPHTKHSARCTHSPLVSVLVSPSFMYTHSAQRREILLLLFQAKGTKYSPSYR